MSDILSTMPGELEVGVFSDNLLSTQLDTQERINSLFTDFNVPDIQHSSALIPKDYSTDDILKAGNLPSRNDYLTSPDPKLNELANNMMAQDSAKNRALTKGFGLPSMVRYQEGQEKFTDDHWWSEAGKTKFGFNPYATLAENDDFYHTNVWNNYSLFGKIWRGTGTFAGRVLSKLVTGLVGMVGDIGAMAWNGMEELNEAMGGQKNNFWADVSDNWLARTMEEADEYVKQQVLPTYKSINYDDKGAFAKLTDPTFWMNDIADGAGFLLQFAIPATLLGKAAVLGKAGKLGRFGRVMSAGVGELETSSRLARGTGATLEFLTGSRNVGGITAHAFNTTMESVAETKEGFNATVEELMRKGYSEHEAKQMAAESAPFQFGANMAILSFSNAFENKWFQRSVGNRINPFRSKIDAAGLVRPRTSNVVGKFFTNNKWGNRIYFYGANGAKAAAMEGYWEENAQLAAQRVARGEYQRRGEDTLSTGTTERATNFFKQLVKQTSDAASNKDREAADSIMAGAVIGILGGSAFAKFSGSRNVPQVDAEGNPIMNSDGMRVTKKSFLPEGTRRRENRENAETVARVKNARDAWLSINTMPQNIYNEDGTLNEEKALQRVDELNEKLAKVASVTSRKITLDQLTDQTERENKQYVLFGDFVKAHILNGSGEALINRIKNWGKKTKDELAMYGVEEDIAENPLHWANVAQTLYSEYSKIDRINFVNPKNPETGKTETADAYFQKERAVKSLIFDYIAQREASKTTAARYAEMEQEANPFLSVDTFNSYNALIARREALRATIDQEGLDEDSKDFFRKDLERVNQQIDVRKNSLPEHQTGNTSDMVFEPDTDVDAQERAIMSSINEYLGYQFAKEDFLRSVEAHDKLIKEYSDPQTGIQKFNDVVDYWAKAMSKTRLAKLTDLGYTEAEVTNMTPEEQQKLIDAGLTKEEAERQANQPPVPTEEEQERSFLSKALGLVSKTAIDTWTGLRDYIRNKLNLDPDVASLGEIHDAAQARVDEMQPQPTDTQLRQQVLALLKLVDPKTTEDNLDAQVDRLLTYMQNNPDVDVLTEDGKNLLTLYVQSRVVEVKQGDPDADSKTEKEAATPENAVVQQPDKPFEDLTAQQPEPAQEKTAQWKVGDVVLYNGYEARILEVDTHTQNKKPIYHITDKDGNPLLEGGIRKYVFGDDFASPATEPKVEVNVSDDNTPNYQGMLENNPRMALSFSEFFKVGNSYFGYYIKPTANWQGKTIREMAGNHVDFREMEEIGAATENRVREIIAERYAKEPPFVAPPPGRVEQSLLDEIREAYRLNQQALENDTTFKEEAEREGMKVHNNRLDYFIDEGKFAGTININTSNPRDLVDGNLKTADNNLARFNFMDNLLTGRLNPNDYKMTLAVSEKDTIFGIVADTNGTALLFNDKGMPVKTDGLPILFYLDMEMYENANLGKRRKDVVKPPFPLAPLMTFINPLTGKSSLYNLPQHSNLENTDRTFVNPPITLNPAFEEKNVIQMLKDRIKKTTVTASFSFLTQGMLYREGTDNSYSNIPKNPATQSAKELWDKGHLRDEKGEIPLEDMIVNGVYRRAHRIQFQLLNDVNNQNAGTEVAEFHAVTIGEVVNEKGEKLWDILKAANGQNFFEAAIQGNLESTKENLTTLNSLLRPDKFKVFNLGANILVINLKRFKKYLTDPNVTADQLRSLTTIDDIKNSDLNFTKTFYDNEDEVELLPGILEEGRNNYSRFINRNVTTSARPLKKGNTEGYARVNKRIALTLDMNMDELNKAVNQKEQENKAPGITEVTVQDELSDKQKSGLIFGEQPEEDDLSDDFTKTDCK
jgi:hypothetical protein